MRKIINIMLLAAATAACSDSSGPRAKGGEAPLVVATAIETHRFVDRIDAVGTALANEQVTLTAPVTERVLRLNFDDGAYVQKGQVIAVLAAGQENAQLSEANARSREAAQQLQRLEQLKARGFATNSALDTQVAVAAQARAQAENARAAIEDRVVRAPFSGWVSLRNISPGAVVSAGTQIAQISDISRIKLDFAVPETLLARVRSGQAIQVQAAAFPDQVLTGTISHIDPVLNPETRSATVRAVLPNPDRRLKPGMLMTVLIESEARTSPAINELAIVNEGDSSFVFVIEGDTAKRVEVRTGLRQDGKVEILEGLAAGQKAVTDGVVKIRDGQKVRLAGAKAAEPATKGQ